MAVSRHGNIELIKLFLAKGAEVDTQDYRTKETALLQAAKFDHKDAVALLIAKGANINAVDQYDSTPLMEAAKNGNKEIVELLLTNGADVSMRDHIGGTALIQAIAWRHYEIAKMLKAAESGARRPVERESNKIR
jgi:ankyrin repeat protein